MTKAGRPTLYKPEYDEQARKLCLLGQTDIELADFFGVCEDTIYEWKKVYPNFSEATPAGKIKADAEVAGKLHERAIGAEWIEEQAFKIKTIEYDGNGRKLKEFEEIKVVQVQKAAPPDTPAISLWLRNRQPGKWREKPDASDSESTPLPVSVVVQVQDARKRDDADTQ